MEDDLVLLEGPDPVLPFSNVPLDELESGWERGRPIVDRRREVVQDADLVAVLLQQQARALADEAGAAADQHLHCPTLIAPDYSASSVTRP